MGLLQRPDVELDVVVLVDWPSKLKGSSEAKAVLMMASASLVRAARLS